ILNFKINALIIVNLIEPLVRVLLIMDSEDTTERDSEEVSKRKKVVDPYLKILDTHWDSQFRKNLHTTEFEKHKQTTFGLLDVIERYACGDADLNSKLTSEMRIFKNAKQNFERQSAIRERSTLMT
ncbi:hypothetical protein S83_012295, partial [Arachis hypogaea]